VEFVKIVLVCTLASVVYGILHDQVTARICLEYFTVFHPPVFTTQSPTLIGIGWGIIATWWAGAIVGVLIAIAAQLGIRAQLTARELMPMIAGLILFMASCALIFGLIGYFEGVMPAEYGTMIPANMHRRFLADWWAHSASYASGFLGGPMICAIVVIKRLRILRESTH
jgi:predicted permease